MKVYGLIGKRLTHSFSKKYFTEKFEREKISARYELLELDSISDFPDLVKKENLSGLNVTIPYKEQILSYLDALDKTAEEIGAVNTIQISRNSEGNLFLKGYNTDVIGFSESIRPNLKDCHSDALILGTGGAAKGIEYALKTLGIKVKYVSRNPKENNLHYSDLSEKMLKKYTLIVNATPLGMYPRVNSCPDLPYEFLGEKHLLFDAVYNPEQTLFLEKGKARGATTQNGFRMLVEQAEAAWQIYK